MKKADDTDYPVTGRFLQGRLRHAMSRHEADATEAMFDTVERFDDGHVLSRRGELVNRSTILVDGYVIRAVVERDRRHIVGIQVPGDFIDLHGYALKRLDHDLVAVGPVRVSFVDHERLNHTLRGDLHLTRLMWFSTLLDASIHRAWIMKMEQLPADGRLAHLLSEIWERLRLVGLGDAQGFDFPMTQIDLADACGTTAIHMNRMVQKLRAGGVVDIRRGRVNVLDHAQLRSIARYDPDYLYGPGDLAVGAHFEIAD
ncbi:Crp/Fnr family transcriptional regulator [Croceicoccus hydrothermalis]|uniref:Crp/Fnr family transcriptional regulator n=1 Tax=Croceicoccus hydrothermalis TaxID=2867964 RepID=UPI001EFAA545